MKEFQTSRNGYKKEDVREYIDELEAECEDLKAQNLRSYRRRSRTDNN